MQHDVVADASGQLGVDPDLPGIDDDLLLDAAGDDVLTLVDVYERGAPKRAYEQPKLCGPIRGKACRCIPNGCVWPIALATIEERIGELELVAPVGNGAAEEEAVTGDVLRAAR